MVAKMSVRLRKKRASSLKESSLKIFFTFFMLSSLSCICPCVYGV
jgi:hypothetical protein